MSTLQAALEQGRHYPIFPCGVDKTPLVRNGFKSASQAPAQITAWWREFPNALIGVPTGDSSGFLVVDIDRKNGHDGLSTIRDKGWSLPLTRIQETQSGGKHVFFQAPHASNLRCSAGVIGDGIDIRANGGYVIWWEAEGLPILCDEPPAPLPDWLHAALAKPVSPPAPPLSGLVVENAAKVRSALAALDPDTSYQDWVNVGMAIHHATSGGAEGLALWDTWSSQGPKYIPGETAKKWESFGQPTGTPVTLATVFKMASASGWRWKDAKPSARDSQPPPSTAEELLAPLKTTPPIDTASFTNDKPVINVIAGELHLVVDQAESALLSAAIPLYQRGGMLIRPATLPAEVQMTGTTVAAGTLVIEPVTKPWLAEAMNKVARWEKYNERKKGMVPTDCPDKYADHYLARKGEWKMPVLVGIVEAPTLRRDGSLLTQSGYDAQSGLYLNYTGAPVTVSSNPTRGEALTAMDVLKEPFEEFPFVSEIDRSVALSGLLTATARRSLRTAPYHGVDAPTPGSGKGLLVDACAIVATGRPATTSTLGADDVETEKRMGALLMRGISIVNLDNAARPIEGDFICSLATQSTVDTRILGQSTMVTIPSNTTTIFVTGNNLVFRGDMTRRVLLCRIDPRCERPDAREFKRDLRRFVAENRHHLLNAALTVLRAFVCAGRPAHGKAPYGSFEEWDTLIRGALLWLEQPDPIESRERIVNNDPTATGVHALLVAWFGVFGNRAVPVHEVIGAATPAPGTGTYTHPQGEELRYALLDVASNRDGTTINPRTFSHFLRRNVGKVAGEHRLEEASTHGKYAYWKVCINCINCISSISTREIRSGINDTAKYIGMVGTNATNATNATPPPSLPSVQDEVARLIGGGKTPWEAWQHAQVDAS